MSRVISASIACCALMLAAGCGSSASNGTGGGSGSTAASTSTGVRTGLRPTTTPKYASPSASSPVQAGVVAIAYRNIAIAPDTPRVKVGSTVKWTNYDAVEHNVVSKSGPAHFASGNFGEGKTFEVKLTKPGVIHYLCTLHPTTMNGTIEVR